MLGFVIAVCIGILVGMALGTSMLNRGRRHLAMQARMRLTDELAADARRGEFGLDDIARETTLTDEERATFEQIFRENFPDAAGPPPG